MVETRGGRSSERSEHSISHGVWSCGAALVLHCACRVCGFWRGNGRCRIGVAIGHACLSCPERRIARSITVPRAREAPGSHVDSGHRVAVNASDCTGLGIPVRVGRSVTHLRPYAVLPLVMWFDNS